MVESVNLAEYKKILKFSNFFKINKKLKCKKFTKVLKQIELLIYEQYFWNNKNIRTYLKVNHLIGGCKQTEKKESRAILLDRNTIKMPTLLKSINKCRLIPIRIPKKFDIQNFKRPSVYTKDR